MTKTVITKYLCNLCDGDAEDGAGIRWDNPKHGTSGRLTRLPDSERHICAECANLIADQWKVVCSTGHR